MLSNRIKTTSLVASVAIASLLIGGFLFGNLFTLITGEFPGPGPGYGQSGVTVKVDSTAILTTVHPEWCVTGFWSFAPQVQLWYWSITGVMTENGDGTYNILLGHHAGVLTTIGKNWIEDQMGDSPSTTPATYISLSTSSSSPSAAWTIIPSEITNGGLGRKTGAYASTGDGTWTISYQFTANATHTNVQLQGCNWSATRGADNTLLCADTWTPVTLNSGDKLTATWAMSITGV